MNHDVICRENARRVHPEGVVAAPSVGVSWVVGVVGVERLWWLAVEGERLHSLQGGHELADERMPKDGEVRGAKEGSERLLRREGEGEGGDGDREGGREGGRSAEREPRETCISWFPDIVHHT